MSLAPGSRIGPHEVTSLLGVGGADRPGPTIMNGLVLVNSGYTRYGGIPGNVLLASSVD